MVCWLVIKHIQGSTFITGKTNTVSGYSIAPSRFHAPCHRAPNRTASRTRFLYERHAEERPPAKTDLTLCCWISINRLAPIPADFPPFPTWWWWWWCVCVCVCVCVLVLLMFCFCDSRSQDWTITQNHEWNYRCFGCRDGHAHDQGFGYSVCRILNYKDLVFKVSGMGGF